MFVYQKIKVTDLSKIKPNKPFTNVIVIGKEAEEEFIDELYFKVEQHSSSVDCQNKLPSEYMRSVVPLRFLNEMYLYQAIPRNQKEKIVFVEPKLIDKLGEEEVSQLIKKTNLTEKMRRIQLDPLHDYYLDEEIYYELTGETKEQIGHLYITPSYLSKEMNSQYFFELEEYTIHHEPLVFDLNRKQLLFVAREDLKSGTTRLLELNEERQLAEVLRFQIAGSHDLLYEQLHQPTDIGEMCKVMIQILKAHHESRKPGI